MPTEIPVRRSGNIAALFVLLVVTPSLLAQLPGLTAQQMDVME